jgi:phage terminase large subunit GpA-like protein
VAEWADQRRRLDSQTSAEAGVWRTSRAEYQRGIMDACSDPKVREVVVMAGAQLGKSEALLNIIGFHIDHDPCPILMLQPTESMAQSFSKDRIANGLLRATPVLQGKVKDPRVRDSNNTTLHKIFPGGSISLVGANSPAGLASRPIRVVLADEVDRFPASAGSEGDPLGLARKRTATFWNRKIIAVSTPTIKDVSRIEDAYEKSDMREYYIPCKHCEHQQTLVWANVRWTDEDPETASYLCEECGCLWSDADRRWSVRNGQWVAKNEFTGIAGFKISGLYSPWTPLSDGVREFLSVKKNPEQLKVWTNTYLGQSWVDEGETVDEMNLMQRREHFNQVPEGVVMIVVGADVQDDRIELSFIGIGRDEESWVLGHEVLYGDPSTPQLWTALDTQLATVFETEDGRSLGVRATCVDSGGHFTNTVYQYCHKNFNKRVFAIKGVAGEGKPIAGKPSRNNVVKCRLFPIGTETAKDLLFARLRIQEEGAGYVHFSDTLNDEYFRQLTAEKVITKFVRGYKKRVYQKFRPRNEALDCYVYALGAYAIINTNVNSIADRIEAKSSVQVDDEPKEIKRPFVPRVKKNFVNAWR